MELLTPKVSIIGCGNVGMKYAYATVIKGVARQLVLIDVDRQRIEGEAMDLSHGAPYVSPVEVYAGDYSDLAGSDLVVVTAGKPRKKDQTRIQLVQDNVELFKKIIPEIVKHAPSAILLIISNPVDILSYAAWKISGKPAKEVIGSGAVLDSARLRNQIARHCAIDPRNVHAYILGEHGDTAFPVWSKAMLGGTRFEDYCKLSQPEGSCNHEETTSSMFLDVRDSGRQIIQRKGETSYGIGLAAVRISQAILKDENALMPVSSLAQNYLGIDDVYLSLPAVVNRGGIREVLQIELSDKERQLLNHSAEALKSVIRECKL